MIEASWCKAIGGVGPLHAHTRIPNASNTGPMACGVRSRSYGPRQAAASAQKLLELRRPNGEHSGRDVTRAGESMLRALRYNDRLSALGDPGDELPIAFDGPLHLPFYYVEALDPAVRVQHGRAAARLRGQLHHAVRAAGFITRGENGDLVVAQESDDPVVVRQ